MTDGMSKQGRERLPPSPASMMSGASTPARGMASAAGDSYAQGSSSWDEGSQPPISPACTLRVGSYNVRVDHNEDIDTVHDWPVRRRPVAASILALGADLVALQEPSRVQALHLEADLGPDWGVEVGSCDPNAWAASSSDGPKDGQARDGNGVAWRRSRLELIERCAYTPTPPAPPWAWSRPDTCPQRARLKSCSPLRLAVHSRTFWLNDAPDAPSRGPAWGGSIYQRTCHVSTFRDSLSGMRIRLFSTHFDHEGDDSVETGGSEARRQSAALVMGRAAEATRSRSVELAIVAGDFNTFEDRGGATYANLLACADGELMDVRDAPGVLEVDAGRGDGSWEGWEHDPYCRARAGSQRYDQIFVTSNASVLRTAISEERYRVYWRGQEHWVYASDHLPVSADLALPKGPKGKRRRPPQQRIAISSTFGAVGGKASGKEPLPRCLIAYMGGLSCAALCLVGLLIWLMWDFAGGSNLECQVRCRNKLFDAPWDVNMSCPVYNPPSLPPFAPPLPPPSPGGPPPITPPPLPPWGPPA